MSAVWVTLAVLLVLVGVAGTLLPGLPGAVLILGGLVWLAWLDDFSRIGAGTISVLVVLTVAVYAVDLVVTALGAKRVGASREAVVGAFVGTLAGLFFGLPGLVIGPFVGAFGGELLARGQVSGATRVGLATWLALVAGMAVKLTLVCLMVGIVALAFVCG